MLWRLNKVYPGFIKGNWWMSNQVIFSREKNIFLVLFLSELNDTFYYTPAVAKPSSL